MDRASKAPVVDVEPSGLTWRTSSASGSGGGGNCVELAFALPSVLVRDSKDRRGARLPIAAPAWVAFLSHLRHGGLARD